MPAIRLAPSGPIVANLEGGPFNPGPGAVLRENMQVFPITGGNSDPLTPSPDVYVLGTDPAIPQVAPVTPAFTDCDPNLFYDVRAEFDVTNTDANNGLVTTVIQTSQDGAIWTDRWTTQVTIPPNPSTVTARRVVVQMPPTQGSVLGVTPTARTLFCRAVLAAPTGAAMRVQSGFSGTNIVQLTERF
jgi:hypothetical protein